MSNTLTGGGCRTDFFEITDTGSAYTVGAAPVHSLLTLVKNTSVQFQDNGGLVVDWTQYEDSEALDQFLDNYAVAQADAADVDSFVNEVGDVIEGDSLAASSGQLLLANHYGAAKAGKRKGWATLCSLSKSSGSYGTEGKKMSQPTIKITAVKTLYACTLVMAKFEATLVTAAADVVIPSGEYYKRWRIVPA